jgi:hypothetical protein
MYWVLASREYLVRELVPSTRILTVRSYLCCVPVYYVVLHTCVYTVRCRYYCAVRVPVHTKVPARYGLRVLWIYGCINPKKAQFEYDIKQIMKKQTNYYRWQRIKRYIVLSKQNILFYFSHEPLTLNLAQRFLRRPLLIDVKFLHSPWLIDVYFLILII